jgi:hypothetical protein
VRTFLVVALLAAPFATGASHAQAPASAARDQAEALRELSARGDPPMIESEVFSQPYDPAGAALRSLFVPGLGQFYTGRPALGAVFLGAAGGALTWGLLSEHRRIECLERRTDNFCPPEHVLSETRRRQHLTHGVGAAAAVAVLSAWEAYRSAHLMNGRSPDAERERGTSSRAVLALPAVSSSGRELRIGWLRSVF